MRNVYQYFITILRIFEFGFRNVYLFVHTAIVKRDNPVFRPKFKLSYKFCTSTLEHFFHTPLTTATTSVIAEKRNANRISVHGSAQIVGIYPYIRTP